MSMFDCIQSAIDDGLVDKPRGKKAQEEWKKKYDRYVSLGYDDYQAGIMAADELKTQMKEEAAAAQHRKLQTLAIMADRAKEVAAIKNPEDIVWHMTHQMEKVHEDGRSLARYFVGRLNELLVQHHADLLGRVTDPANFDDFLREIHGEKTGNEAAAALADVWEKTRDEMRLWYNSKGGNIKKLEGWGLAHSHSWNKIQKAGFDEWSKAFFDAQGSSKIDWTKMFDDQSGMPVQGENGPVPTQEEQLAILQNIYDNIIYGKGSKEANYGVPQRGMSIDGSRVLHFKTAQGWMDYNAKFGTGTPFNAMMNQVRGFSHRIAEAERFGVNGELGEQYVADLLRKEARTRQIAPALVQKMNKNITHAHRMLLITRGAKGTTGKWASFFATTRELMKAAFLDRSVIISALSDNNLTLHVAHTLGLSKTDLLSTYGKLLVDSAKGGGMTRDELRQQLWIGQSLANPNAVLERYMTDIPGKSWARLLSNASMRLQGHLAHTDNIQIALQRSIAARWATLAHLSMDQLPDEIRLSMAKSGIMPEEWDTFRNLQEGMYTADNGAKFLGPMYWHAAADSLDPELRNRVFLKMQSFAEHWTEIGVPGQNLWASAFVNPVGFGLTPGSGMYEAMQSIVMFKNVIGSMLVGQYRMVMAHTDITSRAMAAISLGVTDTLVGALALQINDVLMGRDPQDMKNPKFLAEAIAKGGALGPIGDLLMQGNTSWGGGFGNYLMGPTVQLGQDINDLTIKTFTYAAAAAMGKPTGKARTAFAKEFSKLGQRYTPLGQTFLLGGGAALNNAFWDQWQMVIDPNAINELAKKQRKRKKDYGQGQWWGLSSPVPQRMPDLGTAIR